MTISDIFVAKIAGMNICHETAASKKQKICSMNIEIRMNIVWILSDYIKIKKEILHEKQF